MMSYAIEVLRKVAIDGCKGVVWTEVCQLPPGTSRAKADEAMRAARRGMPRARVVRGSTPHMDW